VAAESLSPIVLELWLACPPDHAFAVYTERIGEWWDPRYTANPATLEAVAIEGRVGGRIYAIHSDLGRHNWGDVTVWEPGRRLVHSFTLAQDAEHPSEVRLEFGPSSGLGSVVRFAHGGWSTENAAARAKFGDWQLLLDRFATLADGSFARREDRSA
jgi:Activator of Hsp90 ATPase homolog 1-like protein